MKYVTQITRRTQVVNLDTGSRSLTLTFCYNVRAGLWHVDIASPDGNLADHKPLRRGVVLVVLPEGGLFVDGADATDYDSLEKQRTRLAWFTRAEIEAAEVSEPAAEVVE